MSKSSFSCGKKDANGISRFDKLVQSTIRLYELLPKALAEEKEEEDGGRDKNPMFRSIVEGNLEHLKTIKPAGSSTSKMHQLLGSSRIHLPLRHPTMKASSSSFSKRRKSGAVLSASNNNNHNATFDLASVTQKRRQPLLLLKSPSKLLPVPSKSLYEQHKALLQQRYATTTTKTSPVVVPSTSTEFQDHQKKQQEQQKPAETGGVEIGNSPHNYTTPSSTYSKNSTEANGGTTTNDDNASPTQSADFSTASCSSPSKELEKCIGFTSKLQEAIRTSSSFLHLQQDTRSAYAA